MQESNSAHAEPLPESKQAGRSRLPLMLWTVIPLVIWNGLFLALWTFGRHVEVENGAMENLQAAFLLAGCGLVILGIPRTGDAGRVLCGGLGLLYLTFLVREVDLRRYDLPVLNTLLNGVVRNAWLGALWILGAWWFARRRVVTWRLFLKWLPTAEGILLIAAGILWVLATTGGEKMHLIQPRARALFVEELLETNACWLMLVTAFRIWRKPPAAQR